jgi:DNA-binding NarL/FixJ family response regulator
MNDAIVNEAVMDVNTNAICEQAVLDTQYETANTKQIRVLSADEHPLMSEGIASVINAQADMRVIEQASCALDAIQLFGEHVPDVALMDLRLPDMNGIDTMMAIREEFHDARIMVFSTFGGDTEIRRALAAGARSYMLKSISPNRFVEAIPQKLQARIAEHLTDDPLTAREVEVLKLVMTGNRNREIGDNLSISEGTVKAHVKHSIEKLGANDRTQAVTIALRRGLIQLES